MEHGRGPSGRAGEASPWVRRWLALVPEGGTVLDLACGRGRHVRLALRRGHPVVAVDRDVSGLADVAGRAEVDVHREDLERGPGLPEALAGRLFPGVVVTRYLHRPLLDDLVGAVAPGGALIYETFARGQERLGRPRDPDHLLRAGELLEVVRGRLRVVAYEDVLDEDPPARVQRICAVRAGQRALTR